MGNTHYAPLLMLNCFSLPLPPPIQKQVSFPLCFNRSVIRNEQLKCCGRSKDVEGVRGCVVSLDVDGT